jgi:hypothetical protein
MNQLNTLCVVRDTVALLSLFGTFYLALAGIAG